MTFIMLSATWGEMWRASVRLPRQLHGRCQSIHQRPIRYTTKLVPIQATNPSASVCRLLKKQTIAITISATPTTSINFPNVMPKMGSSTARNLEVPNPLETLAIPVMARTAPTLRTKNLKNGFLVRSTASSISGAIASDMISI